MRRTLHGVAWLLAILATQPSVWGHHSVSAVFDQAKFITVTGTLTKVDWFNPHIAIIVDVAGTSGVETWKFQSSPPAWWKGVGVNRADFAKALGQPVTIGAYPSQDGSRYAYMRKITFANGDSLESTSTR
jgi:hypothetical protein